MRMKTFNYLLVLAFVLGMVNEAASHSSTHHTVTVRVLPKVNIDIVCDDSANDISQTSPSMQKLSSIQLCSVSSTKVTCSTDNEKEGVSFAVSEKQNSNLVKIKTETFGNSIQENKDLVITVTDL